MKKQKRIFTLILFILILWLLWLFLRKIKQKKQSLFCPLRGKIFTKKYDEKGFFTEEYYRIKLIKLLINSGISKEKIDLNYRIRVGNNGKNFFVPDLVVKKRNNNKIFLVAEIKKNSKNIEKAIVYQLYPAMRILDSEYGIYYDGTIKSFVFNKNGEVLKKFDFVSFPSWFFREWKRF